MQLGFISSATIWLGDSSKTLPLIANAFMAWFRIHRFWVTQGARKPPACEGRISIGRMSVAGGG